MEDHAFEDFKLKLDYLQAQYQRLLGRFNFFLTVEMALFGVVGWLLFEKLNVSGARLAALLGLPVSILWYVVAAEDRELVRQYRGRVERSAERVGQGFAVDHAAREPQSRWTSIVSWYSGRLSVTRIPVYAAILALVAWLFLLAARTSWLEAFLPQVPPVVNPNPGP